MLTTNQKGAIAENAVIRECILHGIGVAVPIDDERYDLILDLTPELLRVQCKWATRHDEVVLIRCYACRRGPNGLLVRGYTSDEIDAYAAYCHELGVCYLLPVDDFSGRRGISLRLSPSRNNQLAGINWARDFEFGATIRRLHGPIAQLGERVHGMHEAAGSSPAGSTLEGIARTAAGIL
jgi:PD-(D/E)XK endonuclease